MTEQVYIVNQAFKYDGKELQPGDRWEPTGGKWDKQIIGSAMGLNAFGFGKLVRIEDLEQVDESLSGMSVSQLRDLCRERGLPIYGKKADLIRRLVEGKNGL